MEFAIGYLWGSNANWETWVVTIAVVLILSIILGLMGFDV